MKEQNAERLSEYEKAQIEFSQKVKTEFLQGCGGCLDDSNHHYHSTLYSNFNRSNRFSFYGLIKKFNSNLNNIAS